MVTNINNAKKVNQNMDKEEKMVKRQIVKEQFSGIIDEIKETMHMLKQKSFWKIFRETIA